jgi:predicted metal-dependent hydrolase
MDPEKLWNSAVIWHNSGDYHEAHEIFEDLWLELDERREKDTVQTLAQADALAVHIKTGNIRAAQRLMRQLPELVQTFPSSYNGIDLREMKVWIKEMIANIPSSGEIKTVTGTEPPKLIKSRS